MGKQELEKDRVTSLLQLDEWEDDQTATTVATAVADLDSEEEEEDNPEETFEEENKYRETPAEPMHNGQGTYCQRRRGAGSVCEHGRDGHVWRPGQSQQSECCDT